MRYSRNLKPDLGSTIDQLFTLRRLAEMYCEFSKNCVLINIDFKNVVASVWTAHL